jgi:PAS domain S-box-containing protein
MTQAPGGRFDRWSIRARIGALAVVILVSVGVPFAWLLGQSLSRERDAVRSRVELIATGAAQDIEQYLRQSENVMRRLTERPLVRALDPQHCDPLLADAVVLNPEYLAYGVRDRDGNPVCTYTASPTPAAQLRGFAWYAQARQGRGFFASSAFQRPGSTRWVTVLVQPIRDPAGAPLGFLTLPIDLERLGQRLLSVTPADAAVTVLDREGVVLMRSSAAPASPGQRPGGTATRQRDGIESTLERDGVRRVTARAAVDSTDWQVVAGLPEDEAFADYRAIAWEAAGIGVAVVLIAAGLTVRLGSAIATPIGELARIAASVASGNVAARVRVTGPAEVATVAREFNRMLDARDLADARLRGIFDSATDAILTADEAQTIVLANPAAARMFRCPRAELIGSPLERWMPGRFRDGHRAEVQRFGAGTVFARHMGKDRDVSGLRADGEEFPVDAAISHLEVGSQRLYTVILRDVTERREAERALRESEARTRRLLALLPHAVFVSSGDRITFVNQAAQQLFEATEAQLLGGSLLDLVDPDSVDLLRSRLAALRAGTSVAPAKEVKIRRSDGSLRVVEAVATWFEDHGSASLLVVLDDITELKQAQIALRESHADLQRLVEAQDKLLENERRRVARELHDDLQQTLAAIRIDLGAIGEKVRTDPAAVAPMLAEVDDLAAAAIASTRRIVNDLRPRMLEDLGLAPALEALAAQFQQRTGIAAHVDADARASEAALASPATTTCLYRVAQESLNNVAKHAQASMVELQLELDAQDRLALRIADDGQGFGNDERRKPESFGLLGMQERVRALGGTVQVSSRPGEGTTVEVLLPAPAPVATG